jgi:hypothetical protein
MVQLAADTASYLRILAAGERNIVASNIRINIPGRAVSLDFTAFPQPGTGVHAFDLVVSFRDSNKRCRAATAGIDIHIGTEF